ncbi:MAG: hypothetical protein N2112_11125 [Gemmataceae bacterium]|jgi:hypothetical protein|nr:hypothetical protein [Gemmataceae bacterium]
MTLFITLSAILVAVVGLTLLGNYASSQLRLHRHLKRLRTMPIER